MRKIHFGAALAIVTFCATFAFAKSTSFIGGSMRVTGMASAPATGACASPPYVAICPTAPNTTASCACVKVANATVRGAAIGKGTANLSFSEDAGDGDGTDGSITPSNCLPVFGAGTFTDSKTMEMATLNIQGTLCGSAFNGGYSVTSGGSAFGTVSGTLGSSVSLSFTPRVSQD